MANSEPSKLEFARIPFPDLVRSASIAGSPMADMPERDNSARTPDSDHLSVLIVDDCCLYREGLASILDKEPDVGPIRSAHDLPSVVGALARPADLVLVNLATENISALLTAVRQLSPEVPVIAIGLGGSDQEVIACAEAGVAGFLLRTEPFSHLMTLIRSVVAGETVCSPRATAALMRRLANLADQRHRKVPVLTDREDQIFRLLDTGLSNQQIADQLGIELRTVKNHVHHILGKLGVARRGEAVATMRSLRGDGLIALGAGAR